MKGGKQMDSKILRDTEYAKCVGILAELIDLDTDTREKIFKCFQSMGIQNFFMHLELVDLPTETYEKLKSIKSIIGLFDGKGGQA